MLVFLTKIRAPGKTEFVMLAIEDGELQKVRPLSTARPETFPWITLSLLSKYATSFDKSLVVINEECKEEIKSRVDLEKMVNIWKAAKAFSDEFRVLNHDKVTYN